MTIPKPNKLFPVGIAFVFACLLQGDVQAQENAVQSSRTINSIQDVIDNYDPNQHLYIKGDIGAAPQQLADLEKWLDENGPHWTIVLMKNAQGESYKAQDGRDFREMDAVEFAMGHGLANRTSFGKLEHPQTGETDGAVFVLFLEERKFSYYGSDAQDRRSLGESHWIGNLDRQARSAMQNGGRIIDAVKNTVSEINGRLKNTIASEERAEKDRQELAKRQLLERQRAVEAVGQRITETETELIPELEKTISAFKEQFTDAATSSLATPPIPDWQLALKNAAAKVNESNVRDTSQDVEQTIHEIHRMLDLHAAHRAFDQSMAPVKRRWENMTFHSFGYAADSYSKEAEELMDQATKLHAAGDLNFSESLQKAVKIIEQGEAVVLQAEDQDRIAQDRKRAVRRTLWIAGGVAALAGFLILLILNWRRRSALLAAHDAYDKSELLIGQSEELLNQALARRQQITGTLEEFRGRGFTGSTLRLAENIDDRCQSLSRISGELHRVLNQAARLLHPVNPLAETSNMISSSRYHACSRLLSGKSFNASIANKSDDTPATQSWIVLEEFLAVSKTAVDVTNELIDKMADCLANATGRMETAGKLAGELATSQQKLETESDSDGHFRMPALEHALLPAINQTESQAESLVATDPVRVLEEYLPLASQRIENGLQIARSVRRMRDDLFPKLDAASDSMKALFHQVRWIGDRVTELGEQAEKLCTLATRKDVSTEAAQFDSELTAIADRATRTATLAATKQKLQKNDVESARTAIAGARAKTSSQLRVATSAALAEVDHNPDDNLRNAESHLTAAKTAIDVGNVDAASQSVESANREIQTANSLVTDTIRGLEQFATNLARIQAHLQKTSAEIPGVSAKAGLVAKKFAPTAMQFRSIPEPKSGIVFPDAELQVSSDTMQGHLATSQRIAGRVTEVTSSAQELFRAARILESAYQLRVSEDELSSADQMLVAINQHCQRLESLTQSNLVAVREVSDSVANLNSQVADSRCELPNVEAHQELAAAVATLFRTLQTAPTGRDPFQDESLLREFRETSINLAAMIEADFAAFSQAEMAVQGAIQELRSVQRLVRQSVDDQIPDSSTITQCQSDAQRMEQSVGKVQRSLTVAHSNWQTIQEEASRLTANLGIVAGTLVRELQLAEQSAVDFRTASGAVFQAARWTGSYGVAVTGEPGSAELNRARNALSSGDYSAAIELCRVASSLALRAIEIAQAAVQRRQQQIAAEADRRRRRLESSSSIFSSSGSSSGGISFGGGSRSSSSSWSSGSSSRSSSSSSSSRSSGGGSGFSRSGW